MNKYQNHVQECVAYSNEVFFRNGYNSLINVFGLAIGLATCILIFLFVEDELSYDKHFWDTDNIYRLEVRYIGHGEDGQWAASQGDLIPWVTARYPEIKQACKLHFLYQSVVATYGDISFNEDNMLVADTTFLELFGLEPVYGDVNNALNGAEAVVLTESSAIRYFGNRDPVREIIRIFDKGSFHGNNCIYTIKRVFLAGGDRKPAGLGSGHLFSEQLAGWFCLPHGIQSLDLCLNSARVGVDSHHNSWFTGRQGSRPEFNQSIKMGMM
ncbi:MAG: ABC transporter permease [Bacteroidales bacterium]|nr:ABC transporter permease [Bacteroidales bacterium]MCF8376908.1 ABC transporter permease [Bacteroidales bacterium]MCF8400823.1 ABC transporter permease [Bacteroidales bacterium]